jgi:DNA-binding protein H-NS
MVMAKESVFSIYLKSKAKAKAEAKRLALKEIDKLIAVLQEAKAELKKKEADRAAKEKLANIERIKAMMAQAGVSAQELAGSAGRGRKAGATAVSRVAKASGKAKRKPSGPVAPKYRLVIDGQELLWTGRGRTPKVFQAYFDAGNSRESCEIQ